MSQISLQLIPESDLHTIVPLTLILSPYLNKELIISRVKEMTPNGFKVLGAYTIDGILVGISGFWINTRIYSGKYLEPDNVVVHPDYRSLGVGKLILEWLINYANQHHCNMMMLDAYIENTNGHRFYERLGFEKKGFHFLKSLGQNEPKGCN